LGPSEELLVDVDEDPPHEFSRRAREITNADSRRTFPGCLIIPPWEPVFPRRLDGFPG
jgi:hypothetical protein